MLCTCTLNGVLNMVGQIKYERLYWSLKKKSDE